MKMMVVIMMTVMGVFLLMEICILVEVDMVMIMTEMQPVVEW